MIEKMLKRTSIRSFIDKKLDDSIVRDLAKVVNSAPTSMNGQIYSCVFVQDKNKLNQIRELMNQKIPAKNSQREFIKDASLLSIFCIDINRLNYACSKNNCEPIIGGLDLLATFTGDTYIGATMLMDASISIGLGTCFLGSIKGIHSELKELLKLEGNIIPIIGLLIGYPNQENDIKPKINKVYFEEYSLSNIKKEVDEYDSLMNTYLLNRNSINKDDNWSKSYSMMISNKNIIESGDAIFKTWVKSK